MAQIPIKVKESIDKFINALEKNNIPIVKAILFGSYAKGTFDDWSDIDIALVSKVFVGNRFRDRSKIRPIKLSVSSDIEVLPYRPQDFNSEDPFVKEIMETGIRIV